MMKALNSWFSASMAPWKTIKKCWKVGSSFALRRVLIGVLNALVKFRTLFWKLANCSFDSETWEQARIRFSIVVLAKCIRKQYQSMTPSWSWSSWYCNMMVFMLEDHEFCKRVYNYCQFWKETSFFKPKGILMGSSAQKISWGWNEWRPGLAWSC